MSSNADLFAGNEEDFDENQSNISEQDNLVYQYKMDLDYHYKTEDQTEVNEILNSWGFGPLIPLFYYERIDMDALQLLNRELILRLLKKYGLGIRLKFIRQFELWKSKFSNDAIKQNISSTSTLVCHSSNISQITVNENTFLNFLKSSSEGRRFDSNHPKNEILSMDDKRDLCKMICGYLLLDGISIGKKEAQILAESIAQYFVKENPKVYYEGDGGLLYSKAKNMTNSLRQKNIIAPPPKKKKRPNPSNENQNEMFGGEETDSDTFVRTNPFDVSELFKSHWRNSSKLRLYNIKKLGQDSKIQDIVQMYKTLQRDDGFFFLDIDFNITFPSVNYNEKWQFVMNALSSILANENKNAEFKNMFVNYNSYGLSAQILVLFYGAHGYLYSGSSDSKSTQKKRPRETIKQSFNKIFPVIGSEALVSTYISDLQEECRKKKETIQPFIICFGSKIESIQEKFLLVFDEYKYKFNNVKKAIEVMLKMYMIFNLQFPKSNKNVLEFFTGILFDVKYALSTKTKALTDAVNSFECLLEEDLEV